MGRRARGRPEAAAPPPSPSSAAPARRRKPGRASLDELPRAPWHPVPVGELCVLVGLVLIAVGFLTEGERSRLALVSGIALASIAGLEQALREHLAGFRSHSTLLAGFAGLALGAGLAFVVPYVVAVVAAAVVFAVAFWRLRAAFRARAGVAFRA